jgi:hypothetical protein
MQKEATKQRKRIEIEGKHIYPLYKRYCCL